MNSSTQIRPVWRFSAFKTVQKDRHQNHAVYAVRRHRSVPFVLKGATLTIVLLVVNADLFIMSLMLPGNSSLRTLVNFLTRSHLTLPMDPSSLLHHTFSYTYGSLLQV